MARKRHTHTPRTITLRASHGRAFVNIPISIFFENNTTTATGNAQAIHGSKNSQVAGRDLNATSILSDYYRELLTERDKRICGLQAYVIELKEHISELKDRLSTTPRPDLDAVEVETSTHPRQ